MNCGTNNRPTRYVPAGTSQSQKVLIIGGSAGGAGVAAKLRRLNEQVQIVLIDRASSLSYANCGIPYYVGDVIRHSDSMYALDKSEFRSLLNVDVRLEQEILDIDRSEKTVLVRNLRSGKSYQESYDKLVFATGTQMRDLNIVKDPAAPIFHLNNQKGSEELKQYLQHHSCGSSVVIGGGFVGVEISENLHQLGLQVSIVESADQVLASWDSEMAAVVKSHLNDNGIRLYFNEKVAQINSNKVILSSGKILDADVVVIAAGVTPNVELAKICGLDIGGHGGVLVNQFLETQDPDIFALGDAIEVPDHLLGDFRWMPFAGPAQKQARVVAENLFVRKLEYQAPQFSAIVKVFALTAAMTGYSEKQLRDQRIAYEKIYVESPSHASFYPGAKSMMIKLLFTPEQGRILGAQIIGGANVDKRIDIIATAMQAQMSVNQLASLDLSYAPPYSSAKDPVNVAGMVAQNVLQHKVQQIHWNELDMRLLSGSVMLDVRSEDEFKLRALPGAINIPLSQLRQRMYELSKNEDIVIYCNHGKQGYFAYQMLVQHGFTRVKNLSGGITVYSMSKIHKKELLPNRRAQTISQVDLKLERADSQQRHPASSSATPSAQDSQAVLEIDASGLSCPGPIMKLAKAMSTLAKGDIVRIVATDFEFVSDVKTWCQRKGHQLLSVDSHDSQISIELQKTS